MTAQLQREDWQTLTRPWTALLRHSRPAAGPFVSPQFQSTWWDVFGAGLELDLHAVRDEGEFIGVLPLARRDGDVAFIGDPEICDYMDLVAAPGRVDDVIGAFLEHLEESGARRADLRGLPEGSPTLTVLPPAARTRGWTVQAEQEAICPVVPLAADWDSYLDRLRTKYRHEVRRKLRNLLDGGATIALEVVEEPSELLERLPDFVRLMTDSRGDKAAFMTEQMDTFLRKLVSRLAPERLLRLYFLQIDGKRVAADLGLLQDGAVLLYNSGYDPAYRSLAVGIASKVFLVRDSIERGLSSLNFLRGAEEYKFQLGARPSAVTRLLLSR